MERESAEMGGGAGESTDWRAPLHSLPPFFLSALSMALLRVSVVNLRIHYRPCSARRFSWYCFLRSSETLVGTFPYLRNSIENSALPWVRERRTVE